jgi:hypothetical protein
MKIHWEWLLISSLPNLGRQKLLVPLMDDVKSSFFFFPLVEDLILEPLFIFCFHE